MAVAGISRAAQRTVLPLRRQARQNKTKNGKRGTQNPKTVGPETVCARDVMSNAICLGVTSMYPRVVAMNMQVKSHRRHRRHRRRRNRRGGLENVLLHFSDERRPGSSQAHTVRTKGVPTSTIDHAHPKWNLFFEKPFQFELKNRCEHQT